MNLFRRFEFTRYSETRRFLDALAELSARVGRHPQNINFGATYVNITLEVAEGESEAPWSELAQQINALTEASGER